MTHQPRVRWPCDPPFRITQHYGENPNTGPESLGARYGYGPQGHQAVDLVVETPPHEVLSPMRGRVRRSVSATGYGLSVTVHDPADDSTFSRLSHLSGFLALPGALVEPGDLLGYMGRTGNTDGAHVDWELWIAGERVDPEAYLRAQEEKASMGIWKGGWHLGNKRLMTETDWAILRACPPGALTFLSGERIGKEEIQDILAISPGCTIIVRPYYTPQPYTLAAILAYQDQCLRDLEPLVGIVPPGQLWLKPFNEANQPRGHPAWEGFGADDEGMRQYTEAFLTVVGGVRARFGSAVRIGFGSLAPGNRDVWYAGDPQGAHYYYHGPEAARANPTPAQIAAARASCLCREAIATSDGIFWHTYIHEHPEAWSQAWLGRRHETAHRLYPDKAIYIVEAGFPRRDLWPEWGGQALGRWTRAIHADPTVAGVTFWILGDAEDWGTPWYDGGQPRAEVYELARLRAEMLEGGTSVAPPVAPELEVAIGQAVQGAIVPLNPQAAFEIAAARRGGLLPASREVDVTLGGVTYRAQAYRAPGRREWQEIVYCPVGAWGDLTWFERRN